MSQIVLTEEQENIVAQAHRPVPVYDSQGRVLGHVEPPGFTAAILAEAKRRLASGQPRIPSRQVLAHLRALEEEWERTGGFDQDYARAFLDRLRAGEQP